MPSHQVVSTVIPLIEITRHIFVGSKASWEVIPDGIPQVSSSGAGKRSVTIGFGLLEPTNLGMSF